MTRTDKTNLKETLKLHILLRWYQKQINEAVKNFIQNDPDQRAQVYSPTGSGKTVCFEHTVREMLEIANKLNQKINICVVHPRIALSQDQLQRFQRSCGLLFHFTSFHCGAHVQGGEDEVGGKVEYVGRSTTDLNELLAIISNSDQSHITFSSYHSFDKLQHLEFDLVIFDEGHNLTKNQFFPILQNLGAKKAILYTATPIIFDENDKTLLEQGGTEFKIDAIGMNNVRMFGKVLITIKPKDLVNEGFIIPPVAHFLKIKSDKKGENVKASHIIAEAFKYQEHEVKKFGMPYHQMLVTSRGVQTDHKEVRENLQYIWNTIGDVVDVYCIASNECYINEKKLTIPRADVLNQIKNSEQNAIIVHYDTLAEGLDIDSITGNLILRNVLKYKILQLIGRAGRPFRGDLSNHNPIESSLRKKRVSVVTFPIVDGVYLCGGHEKEIAEAFIDGGYDQLSTVLSIYSIDDALGSRQIPDLPEEDDPLVMSNVKEVEISRYVNKLLLQFSIDDGDE
jgi:superfamily II DNA or RNA helicase